MCILVKPYYLLFLYIAGIYNYEIIDCTFCILLLNVFSKLGWLVLPVANVSSQLIDSFRVLSWFDTYNLWNLSFKWVKLLRMLLDRYIMQYTMWIPEREFICSGVLTGCKRIHNFSQHSRWKIFHSYSCIVSNIAWFNWLSSAIIPHLISELTQNWLLYAENATLRGLLEWWTLL